MQAAESYVNERLDHLGIVAGVCQEIGLAAWLDEQDPTNRQQVSVGTATTAMILNGLGFSNRQLYLVPQYFANKPVEHLLGRGITAEMLNDDCLGARSIGSTPMIPPSFLQALPAALVKSLASPQLKSMWIRPPSR